MEQLLSFDAMHWVARYRYWAVAIVIGLESMGLPLPGETVLITAALAGAGQGGLRIVPIILAAVTGAVVGDSAGYWIGRRIGVGCPPCRRQPDALAPLSPFLCRRGIVWATVVGAAAYGLGSSVHHLSGVIGAGLFALALLLLVGIAVFIRRNEEKLLAEAERALPGPLRTDHRAMEQA